MKRNIIIIIILITLLIISYLINLDTSKEQLLKHQDEEIITTKLEEFNFKIEEGHIANCITCDISTYDNKKVLYYKQTFELYLCQNKDCYTIKQVLDNNMTTLDNILSKAKEKHFAYDGGSGIYYFDRFNIVTCNRLLAADAYNTNIYIGDKDNLIDVDVCKLEIE